MLRGILLFLLTTSLAVSGLAQDWVDQGSITSREYRKEIRGAAGVEATEFFTLEYSVAIQIVEVGRNGNMLCCDNKCQGKVHTKHADCDFSCDKQCPLKNHKMTLQGEYRPDRAAMDAATAAANGLAVRGGGTVSPNDWSHRVSSSLASFRRECRKRKTFDMPHAGPCGGQWWHVGTITKQFKVRGTIKKVGYRMSRGTRTPINQTVGTHTQVVASGDVVQEDPFDTNTWQWCRCTPPPPAKEFKAAYFGPREPKLSAIAREDLEWRATQDGVICYDAEGNLLFDAKLEIAVSGDDMNSVKLVITNKSGQTVRVVLPPGVIFLPTLEQFQKMCSLTKGEVLIEAGETETLYANVGPAPRPQGEMLLRWACLEMLKREPDSSARYRIVDGRDDAMANLATITARASFRGPHDQIRMWILTDRAKREEINKRIVPGASAALYSILLRDVAVKGGVDFREPEWAALIAPNLLEGLNLDDRAVSWLIEYLCENREKDFLAYLAESADTLSKYASLEGGDGPAFVAWIAADLMQQESLDFRRAGARILMAAGEAARPAVAKSGGLLGLRWLLASGQEAQCELALDLFEAFAPEGRDLLLASASTLPTEAQRARAAKVLGIAMSQTH